MSQWPILLSPKDTPMCVKQIDGSGRSIASSELNRSHRGITAIMGKGERGRMVFLSLPLSFLFSSLPFSFSSFLSPSVGQVYIIYCASQRQVLDLHDKLLQIQIVVHVVVDRLADHGCRFRTVLLGPFRIELLLSLAGMFLKNLLATFELPSRTLLSRILT